MTARRGLIPLNVDGDVLPAEAREVAAIASAFAFTCASVTVVPYESQLFQPIGGVGASDWSLRDRGGREP
jgi:hypothetical protein